MRISPRTRIFARWLDSWRGLHFVSQRFDQGSVYRVWIGRLLLKATVKSQEPPK